MTLCYSSTSQSPTHKKDDMFLRHFPSLLLIVVSILPTRGGPPHPLEPMEVLTEHHAMGGTYQSGIITSQSCLDACTANVECTAVDFDFGYDKCWHYDGLCAQLYEHPYATHYRFVICAPDQFQMGGIPQPQYNDDVRVCVAECRQSGTCLAVDYNHATKACYIHTRATACNNDLKSFTNVTNYAVMRCA